MPVYYRGCYDEKNLFMSVKPAFVLSKILCEMYNKMMVGLCGGCSLAHAALTLLFLFCSYIPKAVLLLWVSRMFFRHPGPFSCLVVISQASYPLCMEDKWGIAKCTINVADCGTLLDTLFEERI